MPITLVESGLVGGECSYYACMPSKTLLRAPELREATRRAPGVEAGPLDLEAIFGWRDWVTSDWDDAWAVEWLEGQRVDLVRGQGRVVRPGVVEVDGQELEYDTLVVATGSSPVSPPVEGLEEIDAWQTNDATSSHEVPASLIVLGGGVAGCELAQLYRRLGADVTVVQRGPRLIPRLDAEAAETLQSAFEEEGIRLRLGTTTSRVRVKADPGVVVELEGETLEAERLLVSTGRKPNGEGLGLETLGVVVEARCRRGRRAPAGSREHLRDRGRHRHGPLHPRRQVPGPGRRRQHRGPDPRSRLPGDPRGRFHRPADRRRRANRGRRSRHRPHQRREHLALLDLRTAEAARLPQARRRPASGTYSSARSLSGPRRASGASS